MFKNKINYLAPSSIHFPINKFATMVELPKRSKECVPQADYISGKVCVPGRELEHSVYTTLAHLYHLCQDIYNLQLTGYSAGSICVIFYIKKKKKIQTKSPHQNPPPLNFYTPVCFSWDS